MTTRRQPGRHITALSLGAGVQSSTLYLMGVEGKLLFDLAIFADTGEEPQAVYDHLAYLESLGGPEIVRVDIGYRLGDDILSNRRHPANLLPADQRYAPAFYDIPAFFADGRIGARQCTETYKIVPIRRELRRRIGRAKDSTATQLMGISTDEWHRVKPSRVKWAESKFPLIDMRMTRADCLTYWRERIPNRTPPKSACTFCPFHAPRQWLDVYRLGGRDWDRVVEIDDHIGQQGQRLTRHGLPIAEQCRQWDEAKKRQPQLPGFDQGGWGNECAGVCGV